MSEIILDSLVADGTATTVRAFKLTSTPFYTGFKSH